MSSPAGSLSVKLLLFATYAELVGRDQVLLEVPSPATVADVVRRFRTSWPGADRVPDRPMAAVNRVHARPETPVADGDEVALLPPLAGG
ncbi:MAG: MoaD/ThiS family protein [Gemmatimonadales bacterium]